MSKLAIYNHGKDSQPWGEKALVLAEVAKAHGYTVISPDYRGQTDPEARVDKLLATDWQAYRQVVLIGSSMGAYVATAAAPTIRPQGLFLLAPAFYLPGYPRQNFAPPAERTRVYHGWNDTIVPPENAWRFCRTYKVTLTMFDSDHNLLDKLPQLTDELDRFLARCV